MEANFWHERWELGQIGFHEDEANPLLVNHIDKLNLDKGARIFLPLCGKSLDLAYLHNLGYRIVGVELSEIAIKELFQELDITPTISTIGDLKLYKANNIEIFVGDFFTLTAETLGKIDAIYDRAALIALPLEMRIAYKKHLTEITHTMQQLLICVEYDQSTMNGPPFSITVTEIQQHYDKLYAIECLESNDIKGGLKGKAAATESAWILKKKA